MRLQPSSLRVGAAPVPSRHLQTATGFARLAALSVQVFIKQNLGQGLLNWGSLCGVTFFLLLLGWWENLHVSLSLFSGVGVRYSNHTSLRNYAFAFFALGLWQRRKRLAEEKRGVEPHNYWHGDGYFDFLPVPQKYIDSVVEPLVVLIAGALIRYRFGCAMLGLWIMAAACALFLVERTLYSQAKQDYRDKRDLDKEARWDAEMLSHSGRQGEVERGPGEAGGVATGIDAGLAAEAAKRRREMNVSEGGGL